MNKRQIETEFQRQLNNSEELQAKLEKAVNLFRTSRTTDAPASMDKFQTDAKEVFFKIAELVTRTYADKKEWDEKENTLITSYSRESTANVRSLAESMIIDEIRQNVQIGYDAIIKNKAESEKEYHDLCRIIKQYYSKSWRHQ